MSKSKTILLVEDNEHLNKINSSALRLAGYQVVTALTIGEAWEQLAATKPDAIVLDILLPDGSGVDFCREIRQRIAAPILFLTSVTGYEQALEGMRAGGDDYLNKPFRQEMLLTRMEAFWRRDEIRKRIQLDETITRGPLALHIISARACLHGEDMLLSQKEFALLLLLVQNEGKTLPKEFVYQKVWGQDLANDSKALYMAVSRLKRKLAAAQGEGIDLAAIRGEGYRFCFEKL